MQIIFTNDPKGNNLVQNIIAVKYKIYIYKLIMPTKYLKKYRVIQNKLL